MRARRPTLAHDSNLRTGGVGSRPVVEESRNGRMEELVGGLPRLEQVGVGLPPGHCPQDRRRRCSVPPCAPGNEKRPLGEGGSSSTTSSTGRSCPPVRFIAPSLVRLCPAQGCFGMGPSQRSSRSRQQDRSTLEVS